MEREEYIKMRESMSIPLITFKYFKEKGLKMSAVDFGNNYYAIMQFLSHQYNFNHNRMINELDNRFELTITENIKTGKIYKIT